MSSKVSLREYLSLDIPLEVPPVDSTDTPANDEIIVHPARPIDQPSQVWNLIFRIALMSRRFETVKAESTQILVSGSLEFKYLRPSLTVIRDFLQRKDAPSIRYAEIPGQTWRTFVIGWWQDQKCGMEKHDEEDLQSSVDVLSAEWQPIKPRQFVASEWQKTKVAACVVMFAPSGILKSEDLTLRDYKIYPRSFVSRQVDRLIELCEYVVAPAALLTDETFSVSFDTGPFINKYLVTSGVLSLEILPIRTFPIRYALAGLIQSRGLCMGVTIRGVRPRHRCQGAMPPETLPSQLNSSEVSRRHNFNDWDLYTLQRSRCEWRLFIAWLAIMQDRVQPLEPGQSLRIGVPFAKQHFLMRSPWPKVPLSSATRAAVMVGSRGRDITIDAILGKLQYASKRQSDVVFNITSLKSGGDASYSRIVFGTIGSSTRQLCLKLYDERLFPLSRVDEYDDIDSYDPSNRLNNLPFAIDIARTEEAVYDRLSDLQGGLVPQCYGVYQFELPDGMKLWGTLMEDLECPTLEQVDASQWSEAAQMDFIRRMRHAFRALRYAGVRHNDEYARNVLCPPLEQSSTGAPGIVILDFGQSLLWLHDDNGTPPEYYRPDESPFRPLLSKAGIDKALVDRHWEPLDEYEY